MRPVLAVLMIAVLAGCNIAAKERLRDDMETGKNAYKRCLEEHAQVLAECDGLRRAYEADLQAYKAAVAGQGQHTTGFIFSLD